jgi:hypothetical protein
MVENKICVNYRFILSMRVSHFKTMSKTVSILKIYVAIVTGELVAAEVASLKH